MDRRTLAALSLGALAIACATGAVGGGPPATSRADPLAIEALPPTSDGSVIQGVVVNQETGEAAADAIVVVTCDCLEGGMRELRTNDAGLYSLRALPPGTYDVQVFYRHADVSRTIDLAERVKARLNFRVHVRPTIVT
ncbi:MAG: carboxypeptidase-like regulatory domain-containing protein [Nannocystaceae bacterium]